ncbi:ATP-binding protein [Leptospira sp. 96542]|nr:ATP-binding protein [Leptospira sp. 96542]
MYPRLAEVTSLLYEWNGTTEIQVEVGIRTGLPQFQILGLASQTTKESRDRIRLALEASSFDFPMETIVINLKPSHILKRIVFLDLAIALGILLATNQIHWKEPVPPVLGNLGLDGSVLGGKELLPLVWLGSRQGPVSYILPSDLQDKNLPQGRYGFLGHLSESKSFPDFQIVKTETKTESLKTDWLEVRLTVTQMKAFQGLLFSVLGNHHSLLLGSPGTGKTMLHKMLRSILPFLTERELKEFQILPKDFESKNRSTERPFRSPHHSATEVGLLGGGSPFQPGEISQAHGGILYLDEALEFKERILESLREPMEENVLEIVRWKDSWRVPCHFTLLLSANPCPCGNYQSASACHCSLQKIRLYLQKISGAFLDRITIFQTMFGNQGERVIQLKEKEIKTRLRDAFLFREKRIVQNQKQISIQWFFEKEQRTNIYSFRKKKQITELSRTIADWELSPQIKEVHIWEALEYISGYDWVYGL